MNFNLWIPGISKVYQIAVIVCLISLVYFVGDAVRLYPKVDFEMMGIDRGTFSIVVEDELRAVGFREVTVWPTSDWGGMDVTIKVWESANDEPVEWIEDAGPIMELIQAFALEGFRYSRALCQKAETEYPLALIKNINVHYYLATIDVNALGTQTGVQEKLVFSETADCEQVAGMSLWEYAALPWSQKTRYFIWSFN